MLQSFYTIMLYKDFITILWISMQAPQYIIGVILRICLRAHFILKWNIDWKQ